MRRWMPPLGMSLLSFLGQGHSQRQRFVGSGTTKDPNVPPARRRRSHKDVALAQSVDVAQCETLKDVERHFPVAMLHIKSPPKTTHVEEQKKAMRWKEIVTTVNADGYAVSKDDADIPPSFFDEGSLDIRGVGTKQLRDGHGGTAPSRQDSLSPDVLQLSGGNPGQHGLALANESNGSSADTTIEPESMEGRNVYGDTPLQLTDMLKERLMELKAEKLREDRNDTYLPRRLKLLSDRELQEQHQLESDTLRRDSIEAGRGIHSKRPPTTLADVAHDVDEDDAQNGGELTMASEVRGGSHKTVGSIFRRSADLIPGGSAHDPFADCVISSDCVSGHTLATPDGSVHLLRCLPRAGFCSRREALAIIASGQVRVDNVVERNPFRLVRAENNIHVASHSSRLRFAPPRLWMYHKPAYVIVSRNDVAGRTLFTKHARTLGMDHLVPVGSLPMRAHGLLLLTNDGELSRFLENSRSMIQQTYLLRVRPAIDPILAHKLNSEGVMVDGKRYTNIEFLVNPAMKSRFSLKVKVRGEMMPIAHLMQHLGRTVQRGGRISFGPFSISGLPVGSLREVTVPPYFMQHSGAVWKEFVERDWPFFRRQRVNRLRRLSRYRELTPKELEELDNFTYEELKGALDFDSQELKMASEQHLQRISIRPMLDEKPLPDYFGCGEVDTNSEGNVEDEIIEDITAVV